MIGVYINISDELRKSLPASPADYTDEQKTMVAREIANQCTLPAIRERQRLGMLQLASLNKVVHWDASHQRAYQSLSVMEEVERRAVDIKTFPELNT